MRITLLAVGLGAVIVWIGLSVAAVHTIGDGVVEADGKSEKPGSVALGAEIFNREWMPNDSRSHGGDGLGPVYNDTSCVACHNAGGSGGAGPVSKNIDILNASPNIRFAIVVGMHVTGQFRPRPRDTPETSESLDPLTNIHAGFRTSRTVVLHKLGVDPSYDSWRTQALNPPSKPVVQAGVEAFEIVETGREPVAGVPINGSSVANLDDHRAAERINQIQAAVLASGSASRQSVSAGQFVVTRSQRNPTALFGLGLIDAIPDEAIVAEEKRQAKESPTKRGRVSRLKDVRIGRLGRKGQTANVEDFVLNACAVEVGLEVSGHPQAMTPQAPKYRATGLDLTAEECTALVAYVRDLSRPTERRPSGSEEAKHLDAGRETFAAIGCAVCHTPRLGNVEGIYSDLLLHNMGSEMGDAGSYFSGSSDDSSDEPLDPPNMRDVAARRHIAPAASPAPRGATRDEWKTPPLWGFRDSGPYLHDGRAQTLEQAVAMHGGQGRFSAHRFFALSPKERVEMEAFLKSLVAPTTDYLAHRGDGAGVSQ
jgi:CxxC motif-containing protein (DUF1111 family)